MKNWRKGVFAILATLVLCVVAVGGVAPEVQAAKWKNMKVSKQPDTPFWSSYKKTSKIRLTVKTEDGTAKVTVKKSQIEKDIAKLAKAMKDGLKKNPKAKITYKAGKKTATMTVNKKKGSFVVKNGSKTVFNKKFTYTKWKKDTYVLKNETGKTTFTLKLRSTKTKKFFRLMNGKTINYKKNTLARFGTTKGKYVFAKSVLPYFTITAAQYK